MSRTVVKYAGPYGTYQVVYRSSGTVVVGLASTWSMQPQNARTVTRDEWNAVLRATGSMEGACIAVMNRPSESSAPDGGEGAESPSVQP